MGTPSKSQCGDTEESMKRWLSVPAMMGTDTEDSPRQLTEPAEGRPGRQLLLKDGLDFASKRRRVGGGVDLPGGRARLRGGHSDRRTHYPGPVDRNVSEVLQQP